MEVSSLALNFWVFCCDRWTRGTQWGRKQDRSAMDWNGRYCQTLTLKGKVSGNGSLTHSLEIRSIFCSAQSPFNFFSDRISCENTRIFYISLLSLLPRKCNLFSSFLYITSLSQQQWNRGVSKRISILFTSSHSYQIQNLRVLSLKMAVLGQIC